uniref:Uncharacterized protein n=1 Tax=Avena sativa TaxID=4498 RepID=A0ACD6AIW8_AVESA
MQLVAATQNMGLLVIVSLLLIVGGGGGGRRHLSFVDAAKTTPKPEMLITYWEAVLPGVPVPPAISDLFGQQNGLGSINGVTTSPNNLKFVEGLQKIGPKYEKAAKSDSDHGDKHVHIAPKAEDLKEVSMAYGSQAHKPEMEGNLKEVSVSYGVEGKDGHNEVVIQGEEDPNKATMSYGSEEEEDPNKATMSYGSEQEEDTHKLTMAYQSEVEEYPNKATMSYGSEEEEDQNKATISYGSEHEDPHKATMSYGSQHEDDKKILSIGHEAHIADKGRHHHHAHAHNHNSNKQHQANVFFFHDMLRPGSIITPTIPPTTSLPALLPRRVADSIPFSTRRLSDIVAMFTPASLQMTREIRWTLDTCEHPRTLPGQSAGCATSLESLVKLPMSLLETPNVRAFSAANLPLEAPGTRALRGRYNVTAVQKVSDDSSAIVTCHDLTYPYAVYYCHTANPTAAYSVTLTSVEDATVAPSTMEALAVCHLDTSKWSPKNPFFELHNLKPGEVTVCHFLTKLSIIWVPGGEQGDAHAAAR